MFYIVLLKITQNKCKTILLTHFVKFKEDIVEITTKHVEFKPRITKSEKIQTKKTLHAILRTNLIAIL